MNTRSPEAKKDKLIKYLLAMLNYNVVSVHGHTWVSECEISRLMGMERFKLKRFLRDCLEHDILECNVVRGGRREVQWRMLVKE